MTSTVRWGFIGAGAIAHGMATAVAALPEAEVAGVASRSHESARAFSERFGATAHTDIEELLASTDIDLVYVATPNHLHAEHMTMALRAGKPVLCEKPFTVDAESTRAVLAVARETGLLCMEAMWLRFVPAVRRMRAIVDSGALGEVRSFHADFGVANVVDPRDHRFDPETGGGALLDLGVYPVSLALMLFGAPTTVAAGASIGPSRVDEQCAVVLTHENGCFSLLTSSLVTDGRNDATIVGSRATLHLRGPLFRPTHLTVRPTREPRKPTPPTTGAAEAGKTARLERALRANPVVRRAASGGRAAWRRLGVKNEDHPIEGNGLGYIAAEAVRCAQLGLGESPEMPLGQTLAVAAVLDEARRVWPVPPPTDRT